MKRNHQIIVLVVLIGAAIIVWSFEWNKHTPAMQSAASIESYKVLAVANPQIHWQELDRAQKTEYKSNGRNPFSAIAPPTPQELKAAENKAAAAKPALPPPPPPPQFATLPPNFKYFGYGTVPTGSPRRAFLTDGDDIFIVVEGDTLLGRYRILKVGNNNLEFQEISSGLHGTAPLEEPPPTPAA